ncbi:TerD family protein, partial [Escherichia coli]
NADTNEELFKYELNEDFSLETGVIAGELYRKNGEWKFNAVGSGYNGGLAAIGRNFGLDL